MFEGLEVVQESEETNMLNYLGRALYCDLHEFPEAGCGLMSTGTNTPRIGFAG